MTNPQPCHSPDSPRRGLLIVISGPSGVGKTTITHRLVERLGAVFSVSMTTRPKAPSDREGVDYFFVDQARFDQAIDGGELLEWARVFDRSYGTPKKPVMDNLAAGRDVVLEIDVNGGEQIKRAFPEALTVFILPPSEEELLNRLRHRGREDEAKIQRRFSEAKREIEQAKADSAYDVFIVNADLGAACDEAFHGVEDYRRTMPGR